MDIRLYIGYIKEKPLNITHPFGKTNLQERKKHNHLPSVEEEA
jgi:hypothetical protein